VRSYCTKGDCSAEHCCMTCTGNANYTGGRLDWSLYTCLTQLYGGIDMYNLLHKDQLHVSALFIGHLQVDK